MLVYHQCHQADEKIHQQFLDFIGRLMSFTHTPLTPQYEG